MPKTYVNGINIYYEDHGKGEPLVLVQGFGGGHQGWFFQVPDFKKRFRVITFDNRGMGKTDRSLAPYTVRTMADDVIGLMDYLGIDQAHILGLSLGGMVAQEIAITYPGRVKKLVLGSTFSSHAVRDTGPESGKDTGVHNKPAGKDYSNMKLDALMVPVVAAAFNRTHYRMIFTLMLKLGTRPVAINNYLEQINAMRDYSTADRLHLIKAQTLVITGTGDRLVQPGNSDLLAAAIPGAKLVKVEGGSHAFFIEMSSRFNYEVLKFLS